MAKPSVKHAGDPVLVSLGQTIRTLRKENRISQEALAHKAEIDRSCMDGIERGEHNITVLSLTRIAAQLNLEISELFRKAGL